MQAGLKIRLYLAPIAVALCAAGAGAQTSPPPDDYDNQSWNDLQVSVPMTKHFDFFTKITMRLGENVTRLNDGRFAVGFVWKLNKSFTISPFFWYVRARNAAGRSRTENRLNLQFNYRFPFKKFGLSHRSTFEYRERRPVSTWRYRPSLQFDKDLPKNWIPKTKFFIGDEVFYDSATDKFSRNRFSIGITKTLTKQLSVDVYYMRQNDNFAHPGDLNVIWTAWKLRL